MKARTTIPDPKTNPGKLRALDALHQEYIKYMKICVDKIIEDKIFSLAPSQRILYFPKSEVLTRHVKANCQVQAVELVNTWVTSVYTHKLKSYITKQKFAPEIAKQLYTIGKYRVTSNRFGATALDQNLVDLYWSWVWNPEIAGNSPKVSVKIPMRMTELTVVIRAKEAASHFKGLWLKISSLIPRQRISIPLKPTPYLTDLSNIAKTLYTKKTRMGWVFYLTDKSEEPIFDGSAGKIGIDVGLNTLAATSSGELCGQKIKNKFQSLHNKVKLVRANRQRQGLTTDSLRLWKLEQKLSGQIKTAVGTITNKLVKKYKDHTFVVEDLDLSGCKGSKRFAYKALQNSLARKAVIEKINPAYTSQMCPSCGFISKPNRNGVRFQCKSCGRKGHADCVGGRNILGRSGDKNISLKTPVQSVKVILRERYLLRRNSSSKLPTRKSKTKRACMDKPETHFPETGNSLKLGSALTS